MIKTTKKIKNVKKRFSSKIIGVKKNITEKKTKLKNTQKDLCTQPSLKELMKKFTEIKKEDPLNFSKYSRPQSIKQRAKS